MNARMGAIGSRLAGLIVGMALCVFLLAEGITREVPYGGLEGKITMAENGRTLANVDVVLREIHHYDWEALEKLPEERKPKSYFEWTDDEGRFRFHNVKAGEYFLQAHSSAHSLEPTYVSIREGKAVENDYELEPEPPNLSVYSNQHVFRPSEKLELQIHGFVPDASLHFTIYRLDLPKLRAVRSLYQLFEPLTHEARDGAQKSKLLTNKVMELDKPITQKTPEGTFQEFFRMPTLPEGDYWIECSADGAATGAAPLIKDLSEGAWISVSKIGLVTKTTGSELVCWVADLDTGAPVSGATILVPKKDKFVPSGKTGANGILRLPLEEGNQEIAMATLGGSSALIGFYGGYGSPENSRVVLYTDRPIYRPGDEVQFKGIVRGIQGANYALPGAKNVTIEIRDSSETLLEKRTLPLSQMGTFFGSFGTNREAEPGMYSITTKYGEEESTDRIEIAAYRKPEYKVTLRPEKGTYVKGDTVKFLLECQYYYGSPVAGAKVEAHFNRSPHWEWVGVDEEDAFDFEEYEEEGGGDYYGGEYIEDVSATTDENGRAVIELDTSKVNVFSQDEWYAGADTDLSLWVDVTDGDKYCSGDSSVVVARGDVQLGVHATNHVLDVGKPLPIEVTVMRPDGKTPVSGAQVKLVSGYEVWAGVDSQFKYQETLFVTTGPDGKVTATFTPKHSGSLQIRGEVTDSRGNKVKANEWTYISGEPLADSGPPKQGLTLQLDRARYAVGDACRAVVTTDKPGGYALLTVEADRVYSTQILRLDKAVNEVRIPVLESYRPNVYIAVCSVYQKSFSSTKRRLKINMDAKTLQVKVTSNKAVYEPGETATYTVRTADMSGRPQPAEVSLGVVDEAIYDIAEDTTDILGSFYPVRSHSVQTNYSFEEVYLDGGDKAPKDIQIRSDFKDTAFWNPIIQTGPTGTATVQVKLPDNLTSWRATAVAVTGDTSVGMTTANVRAKKDLMVRLQTPRYLVQGDTHQLLAMVTNESGSDANVNVLLDSPPLPVKGDLRQSVRVPNGGTRSIEWTLSTPKTGDQTLTVKAWIDGGASDGERKTIEVQPHGRLFVDSMTGDIQDQAVRRFQLRPGADPNTGSLKIAVSPTLASSLVQSLDSLIDYPYGCVEQTMSRFMPTVVVAKAVKDAGIPGFKRMQEVPRIVADSLTRLKRMQHGDGAWGWWENDDSEMFMTSLVLEGLYRSTEAGYPARGISVKPALDWLEKQVVSPLRSERDWYYHNDVTGRLYACYALARYGRAKGATTGLAYVPIQQVGPYESAMLALTYHALGAEYTGLRDQALKLLVGSALESNGMAHWPERYWGVETTARCLAALAEVNPHHPLISKVVRYLMMNRTCDGWYSTRDTSYVIVALTEFWRASGGIATEGHVTVRLNGREVKAMDLSPTSIFDPDLQVYVPLGQLQRGENRIEFTNSGKGTCYFTVQLRQTVVEDRLSALTTGAGLEIARANYLLSPQRLDDGTLKLMPGKDAVTQVDRGDILQCQVTINNQNAVHFAMIEVPVPSNCRVVERTSVGWDEEWYYPYQSIAIKDDRVSLFVDHLDPGSHTYEFTMRAEKPGRASALPATVFNMYDPGIRASSSESPLEVRAK